MVPRSWTVILVCMLAGAHGRRIVNKAATYEALAEAEEMELQTQCRPCEIPLNGGCACDYTTGCTFDQTVNACVRKGASTAPQTVGQMRCGEGAIPVGGNCVCDSAHHYKFQNGQCVKCPPGSVLNVATNQCYCDAANGYQHDPRTGGCALAAAPQRVTTKCPEGSVPWQNPDPPHDQKCYCDSANGFQYDPRTGGCSRPMQPPAHVPQQMKPPTQTGNVGKPGPTRPQNPQRPANVSDWGRCGAPADCISGGYSKAAGVVPSMNWDICTGCWSETCVRDIDFTRELALFQPGNMDSAIQAALGILEKVYPYSVPMWQYQMEKTRTTGNNLYMTGITNFLHAEDAKSFIAMNTAVHECVHVHHSTSSTYRPSNDFNLHAVEFPNVPNKWVGGPGQYERSEDPEWGNGFPRRAEIWDDILPSIQVMPGGPDLYFRPPKPVPGKTMHQICDESGAPVSGCQRIHGITTETEAYIHGITATSWLNDGVGAGNTWSPKGVHTRDSNEGAPFPVAFWSLANVLYLQKTKANYPETWNNLLGRGTQDWRSTAKVFLAHIDRCTYLMRLWIDKNGMPKYMQYFTTPMLESRSEQAKALERDDVLSELRAAQEGCR